MQPTYTINPPEWQGKSVTVRKPTSREAYNSAIRFRNATQIVKTVTGDDGKPIRDLIYEPVLDENGNPKLDANGNEVTRLVLDADGNPKQGAVQTIILQRAATDLENDAELTPFIVSKNPPDLDIWELPRVGKQSAIDYVFLTIRDPKNFEADPTPAASATP